MLKNYFLLAYRRLTKNLSYAGINTFGLVIGLCSCILIGLYIRYETGYDRFHEDGERIVRVTMEYAMGGVKNEVAQSATKVGPQFQRTFPAVEAFVRTMKSTEVVNRDGDIREEDGVLYADSSLFTVFTFPLLKGDPATALSAADKVVITESTAASYFGDEDPIGQVLQIGTRGLSYTVSGVAADVPPNSQIRFDFVVPFHSVYEGEEWFPANYITYLRLHDREQMATLNAKVDSYMRDISEKELQMSGGYLTYKLEPVQDVHLHSSLEGFEPNGNMTNMYILGSIALLILIIACINYTNLATAQAARRTGEIGIRKALGARKSQLFGQMLGESVLLSLLALVLALGLAYLLLPLLNQLTGTQISYGSLWQPLPFGILFILLILVSLASGAYPAFVLSHFKLVDILKSKIRLSSTGGASRRSLITFQFAISIFLIIATLTIGQQLAYVQDKDLGYSRERVVVLPVDRTMRPGYDDLRAAVLQHPQVAAAGGAYETPTYIQWGDGIKVSDNGTETDLSLNAMPVDLDFLETMGMELVAGEAFTEADLPGEDEDKLKTFMLNESAVAILGWTPEEAIGKTIIKNGRGVVKAVVKDFHFASLHQSIGPLLIFPDKGLINRMVVRLSGDDVPSALQGLEATWKERVMHRPFEYHFLDEEYDRLYLAEQRMGRVFGTFSVIAILLACLGLFALSAFTTVQRTKEIGIRKVLGASVTSLTALLSSEFLKLVLLAMVIAMPLAWYGLSEWLMDFAYRISVPLWAFAVAGVLAVLLALVAVSFQTIRAAVTNPVESLRSE
ncbi:MAG: ABC transporter permease [Cyclobacteriaceae bacterium]